MDERKGGITSFFKRKNRTSSSETESISPDHARRKVDVQETDYVLTSLDMAEDIGEKLDLILSKLAKLDAIEDRIAELSVSLENLNQKLEKEVSCLDERLNKVEGKANAIEQGVTFIYQALEDLKKKHKDEKNKISEEISNLEGKLLKLDVSSEEKVMSAKIRKQSSRTF